MAKKKTGSKSTRSKSTNYRKVVGGYLSSITNRNNIVPIALAAAGIAAVVTVIVLLSNHDDDDNLLADLDDDDDTGIENYDLARNTHMYGALD